MRQGVIPVLREFYPGARIIHELNVDHGSCRVDLAAIQEDRVIFVELKSRKDSLARLADQVRVFERACHDLIVVLDEKFYKPVYDDRRKVLGHWFSGPAMQWKWPRPEQQCLPHREWMWGRRPYPHRQGVEPHAMRLLELLWREELFHECRRHNICVTSRSSRWPMIRDMVLLMTGREVARAVCRQLRARPMAEGDEPI